ncbi:tetratricopeptide repeat protein [Pelomonas sp. SE-A7]|uniref:tetratricopeptide repeat protein n=1 Tax=Pelomonas sp. SE-A7 TaxID=3054953 RepID=UPI00259CBFAF|nr:tetratricopeptide repeat protein [Pelomonas sp. SE-A7]MDM4768102.1 hypothetical protein [Pelomonas sp. SE-A7]
MPFIGAGLHLLVALFFAIHAVRTGQPLYWLVILFMFPLLGSAVYFFAVFLPGSRLERGARRTVAATARALDPGRELREARAALEATPTAQNQMRLANALLEAGQPQEAAEAFEICLKGPFASDAEIKLGAARAWLEAGQAGRAVNHLQAIRADQPGFRNDQLSLLLARALAADKRHEEARAEFEHGLARFGSFEAHAEYAIWALQRGEQALADKLQAEIEKMCRSWNRHTQELNAPVLRRLEAARR